MATTLPMPRLARRWDLDPTGNWNAFAQTVADAFATTRTHTEANEIEAIATPTGSPAWATPPAYDANGNMTDFPQPNSIGGSYTATYDAWNRLVKLEDGGGTVAEYQYDGTNRRTVKTGRQRRPALLLQRPVAGAGRENGLQHQRRPAVRLGECGMWTTLVLRDHASTRLYALNDALFNVVALTDDTGAVKERFAYQPYGESQQLNPDFTSYSGTDYEWEYRFTGRELDLESMLQINRNRYLHQQLGRWVTQGHYSTAWTI